MMRFLIVLFLALAVGIGLTLLGEKPGYVLITREPWSIETTFTLFIIALLALLVISYLLLRILFYLFATPERVRKWNRLRNRDLAVQNIRVGLVDTINGNWAHALKLLTRQSAHNPMPEIGLAAAAWIAQQKNDQELRDDYLAEASKVDAAETTVSIVKTHLQQQAGQFEQALASARLLHEQSKSNPVVYRMLIDLMNTTGQWNDLYLLLAKSGSSESLAAQQRNELMNHSAVQLIAGSVDREEAETHWKILAKKTRREPVVIASYCKMLGKFAAANDAETMIRNTLQQAWSDELVEIYGLLETSDPAAQLKHAEQWIPEHPDNTILMLTLGRLSTRNSLWGMARSYLEVAVQNGDRIEAFLELAQLYELLGDTDDAQKIYKRGLEKTVSDQPAVSPGSGNKTTGNTESSVATATRPHGPSLAYSNESK